MFGYQAVDLKKRSEAVNQWLAASFLFGKNFNFTETHVRIYNCFIKFDSILNIDIEIN